MNKKEKFLIDSNSLMTASRQYYAQDIVPSFWTFLESKLTLGDILILDLVKDEIDKGDDFLKCWVDQHASEFVICKHVDQLIIEKYAEIMRYVQACGFYNDVGFASWAQANIADPWLIATAATYGHTIITFEQRSGNLSTKNKSKKVKIPDVADNFGFAVRDLYYMMRYMKFKI